MKNLIYFFIMFFCISSFSYGLDKLNGLDKLSGISAIIGNDIILDSEIQSIDKNKSFCHNNVLNDIIIQKLILFYAKKDKSIQITDQELQMKIQEFLSKARKKYINQEEFLIQLENKNFLKELNEKIKNQQYIEKYYNKITDDIDVSPKEIKYFMKKHAPYTSRKVCISYVIFYPKLSEIHKRKTIDFLNQIKKEIHSDADFAIKAILFSEDDDSAFKGGLVKGIQIDHLSKKFSDLISYLKEGEISEPFETDLGLHIIKLEKKIKNKADFRHILIKPKYEINKIKSFAELFRKKIVNQRINLNQTQTLDFLKKNKIGDVIIKHQIWFDENQLSENMKKALLFIKKGKITNLYKETINGKEIFIICQLLDEKPPKPISLEENYNLLKKFVKNVKKKDKIQNWSNEILKKTYYMKINC
ncbi:peptidylprolyl isomerase [Blattabacterium cuenoti]|uniref:peptidylprolyl isomerase n=1 Tax=Blattabacterium cuenoti TaxID=1653831 RepID=UPI001EEA4F73|nr:peptidylprolyl isomerase [Blattabacterium cuenoti]